MYSPTTSSSFFDKLRVARDLEAANKMGLQAMCPPDPKHRGVAHPAAGKARAPLSGRRRQGLGRAPHDLCRIYHALAPASCSIAAGHLARSAPASDPPAHGRSSTALQWPDSPGPAPPTTMHARRASRTLVVFERASPASAPSLHPHSVRSSPLPASSGLPVWAIPTDRH